jgi:dTDP-4-dehydrorhamnose 3,5-epimerase-like enzyme
MLNNLAPHLITFNPIGDSAIGYISVCEFQAANLPFVPKRIYWTYYTPESVVRGRHAHKETEQILIAVAGRIIVNLEQAHSSEILTFVLDSPRKGLYIPPTSWHTMQYSHSSVQLVLASKEYDEKDYIRNYNDFKNS